VTYAQFQRLTAEGLVYFMPGQPTPGTGDAGTAVLTCFRFAILCWDSKRRDSRRRDNGIGINVKTLLLVKRMPVSAADHPSQQWTDATPCTAAPLPSADGQSEL